MNRTALALGLAALSVVACIGGAVEPERLRQIADDHEGEPHEEAARGVLEDLSLPGKGVVDGACATASYEAWGRSDADARAVAHADTIGPCDLPCSSVDECDAAGPERVFGGPLAPLRAMMSPSDYLGARMLLDPTLPIAAGTDIEERWSTVVETVAIGLAAAPGPGDAPGEGAIAVRTTDNLASEEVEVAVAAVDLAACRAKDAAPLAARLVIDPSGAVVAIRSGRTGAAPVTLQCVEAALLGARSAAPRGDSYGVADLWLGPPPPPVEEAVATQVLSTRAPKAPEVLTMEGARKVVKKNGGQVKYCYEKALVETPGLSGRLEVRITIADTGRVREAKVTSSNLPPAVDSCVVAKMKRWEFTPPVGDMVVEYPFVFTPG